MAINTYIFSSEILNREMTVFPAFSHQRRSLTAVENSEMEKSLLKKGFNGFYIWITLNI